MRAGVGVGLVVALAAVGAGAWWVVAEGGPPPEPQVAEVGALPPVGTYVQVRGMAHYATTITQTVAGGLLSSGGTYYAFGFFGEHDTASREVTLVVRTRRRPERLVAYEVMTVEGWLRRPSMATLPPSTNDVLMDRSGYWLGDDVAVLEVVRITSEDGVWNEP